MAHYYHHPSSVHQALLHHSQGTQRFHVLRRRRHWKPTNLLVGHSKCTKALPQYIKC
jgi:hypothetical protein